MSLRASDVEVAIVGAGAAGIGAARKLRKAGVDALMLEARPRLGGRSHTIEAPGGLSLDLGCGWLHSADRNPWTDIAKKLGHAVDRTTPPWRKKHNELGLSKADLRAFDAADDAYWEALDEAAEEGGPDRPAADLLPPDGRWNPLINAISTYINGAELDRVSIIDTCRYHDTETDWRLPGGYGRLIAAYAQDLPVAFDTVVERIDHSGATLSLETSRGTLRARAVIVTVPTNVIAEGALRFEPDLPDKRNAAAGVPLGHAEKVYFAVEGAEEIAKDGRFFGATDRAGTGAYNTRPLGRPIIEGYFGGRLAREIATEGEAAMVDFATGEIVGVLGSSIRSRLTTIGVSRWAVDPFARGSYSHALPGRADARAILAAPVEDRLFFAGEATSAHDFSTAHGALKSGRAAAKAYLAQGSKGRKGAS